MELYCCLRGLCAAYGAILLPKRAIFYYGAILLSKKAISAYGAILLSKKAMCCLISSQEGYVTLYGARGSPITVYILKWYLLGLWGPE